MKNAECRTTSARAGGDGESAITTGPAISARGLSKRYEGGRVTAVAGVDFDVAAGEWVAICGPSGCGKSTLLNMLAAIDTPDAGELNVCGRAVSRMKPEEADRFRRETIGLVFQLHNLLPRLTALENVQVPLVGAGTPMAGRSERAAGLLRRVGLEHRLHASATTLSGGERQRVAVCRALVNRPGVLLADEPTGALDSHSGDQLLDLLEELRRERAMTMVVVTHDREVAARADRVLEMKDGRIG
ncbi:MAG: ABC transporter ATP-binding protein [Phycisphaerales bacterium]|nr:ABC transporter ATP-binding protein [Phycisphaerales bacterium]